MRPFVGRAASERYALATNRRIDRSEAILERYSIADNAHYVK
jgi:hypothetical protein